MRKELEELELIEKYLMGSLEEEEKARVEKRMNEESDFNKEVRLQKALMEGMESLALKTEVQTAQKTYKVKRLAQIYGSIAFILLLGIWATLNYANKGEEKTEDVKTEIKQSNLKKIEEKELDTILDGKVEVIDRTKGDEAPLVEETKRVEGEVSLPVKSQPDLEKNEIVQLPRKEKQRFRIDPSCDTTLVGEEGTLIQLKANSIQNASGEFVTVNLREYYQLSDMVFSNLTTETTNGEMIETGGMIHLEVLADNGEALQLKEGQEVTIKMPYEIKKEGMHLYAGEYDKDSLVVWEEVRNELTEAETEEKGAEIYTIVEKMPYFPGGQTELHKYVKQNTKYPEELLARRMSGVVRVKYIVDENGLPDKLELLNKVHPLMDKEALRVIRSLPNQRPGKQRGEAVKVQFTIPVYFRPPGNNARAYSQEEIKLFNDSVMKVRKEERKMAFASTEERLTKVNSGDIGMQNALDTFDDELSSYILSSTNFGWINCDRGLSDSKSTNRVTVTSSKETMLSLVFHSRKVLLRARAYRGKDQVKIFQAIPTNEKVTLFAVKMENKVPYISMKEIYVSDELQQLNFERVTQEKLAFYVNHFNSIGN